jgi:hypothetical protein
LQFYAQSFIVYVCQVVYWRCPIEETPPPTTTKPFIPKQVGVGPIEETPLEIFVHYIKKHCPLFARKVRQKMPVIIP